MNPYMSWAILLLVAGGLGYYYSNRSKGRSRAGSGRQAVAKGDYLSTSNNNNNNNNFNNSKKAKRRPRRPDESASPSRSVKLELPASQSHGIISSSSPAVDDTPDRSMDNLQFAREFSKVKTGSSLSDQKSGQSQQQNKPRTNKLNKANASMSTTSASSTTGGDADDDLSPVGSPRPATAAIAPMTGDVSDMLEAPAPPASTLRITGDTSDSPSSTKRSQKSDNFKQAETKKQRQQRLKREQNRAMVQEAEQQRRVLLEKQLHTAREHERREAAASGKSKLQQAPAANAWTTKPLAGRSQQQPKTSSMAPGLLDTFDPESSSSQKTLAQSNKLSAQESMENSWMRDLPSEEEQVRILEAMSSENEWTTVSSRKKDKKKDVKIGDAVSEASSSEIQPHQQQQPTPPSSTQRQEQKSADHIPPAPASSGHPLDSDWPA